MSQMWDDKGALVTGGCSDLGRETALALASRLVVDIEMRLNLKRGEP